MSGFVFLRHQRFYSWKGVNNTYGTLKMEVKKSDVYKTVSISPETFAEKSKRSQQNLKCERFQLDEVTKKLRSTIASAFEEVSR